MQYTSTAAQSAGRNDSVKGMALLLAGLFILLLATKYLLFSSGLVERPAPGSVLFHVFDFVGILSIW